MAILATTPRSWRVCVTRDEPVSGPLTAALFERGFEPVRCPVFVANAAHAPDALFAAAAQLDLYAWVVCASARGVRALAEARPGGWPRGLRSAAVGRQTAHALIEAGADPAPVVADADGAEALWRVLRGVDLWPGRRVLVPTTPGGLPILVAALTAAGARVDAVEAYRMRPRAADAIAVDWQAAAPAAAVVASPRVVSTLVGAIGPDRLRALEAVVAIGHTTAQALAGFTVASVIPPSASFDAVARTLADLYDGRRPA